MDQTETHLSWLRRAYELAATSPDPSTQNAALLVGAAGLVAADVNRLTRGARDLPGRWVRPAKYLHVEHAERNALYRAARAGRPTEGLTLYCCWSACADCARAAVECGVSRLVCHDALMHAGRDGWADSLAAGAQILAEGGVEVLRVRHRFDGIQIRFGGMLRTPE